MLQLEKREKETIFMMPDDDPCAFFSTYDEGRDTFSVRKESIMFALTPVGYM